MKKVCYSVTLTLMAVALAFKLAMGSILGMFGLAAVPASQLASMKSASSVMSQMKTRVKARKAKVTKRFAKRAGKRLGTAAAGAATVGTIAVVGAVTYFEASDYCDTLSEVHDDLVLLGEAEGSFDNEACLSQAQSDLKEGASGLWDSIKDQSKESYDDFNQWLDELIDEEEATQQLEQSIDSFNEWFDQLFDEEPTEENQTPTLRSA